MTLVCGINYGNEVVIAADQAVTAVTENGEKYRHPKDIVKVNIFNFGAIAAAGSGPLIEKFNNYLRTNQSNIVNIRNVVGYLDIYRESAAKSFTKYDLDLTGWFFSGLHSFDGRNNEVCLGIYHPGLNGSPAKVFQKGVIEFMGMADLEDSVLTEFKSKWTKIFRESYEDSGSSKALSFLRLLMEDAANTSTEVSSTFNAAITDLTSTVYLQ